MREAPRGTKREASWAAAMFPKLRRHSLRFVLALLCAVLVTRLPPMGFAEDAWSFSTKVEDASVRVVAEADGCSIDVNVPSFTIVSSLGTLTGSSTSTPPSTEHSILRL